MLVQLNTIAPKKWPANYSGTTPTIDITDGVLVGDFAIDTSNDAIWQCHDNTDTAPIWIKEMEQTLQNAYDNSSDPEILTDTTRGALTVKRGSAADTDTIFEGQNNAGSTTFSVAGNGNAAANNIRLGYATTATAAGTTTLTVASANTQYFTGVTTQTIVMPVTSTLSPGHCFRITNLSTGSLTVNSSGGNLVATVTSGTSVFILCILASGISAASWNADLDGFGGAGTATHVLTSNGAGAAPTFQAAAGGTVTYYTDIRLTADTEDNVVGTAIATWRPRVACTVTGVSAWMKEAPTGSIATIDINEAGVSILSTKLAIDVTEKTSVTAATPAVISDSAIAADAEVTFDFDGVGSAVPGKGTVVTIKWQVA